MISILGELEMKTFLWLGFRLDQINMKYLKYLDHCVVPNDILYILIN